MDFSLNLGSIRAGKSRWAKTLTGKWTKFTILFAALLSLGGGLGLLVTGASIGYLALWPSVICLMLWFWSKGDLAEIPPKETTSQLSIDSLLDSGVLARIKTKDPSAFDIWEAAKDQNARWFFQNRYILHHSIFEQFLNKQPGSAAEVWKQAELLRHQYQTIGYPAAVVMIALLRSIPNVEQMLRQAQLELKDIEDGIAWLSAIETKRKLAAKKQRFGGLARDWTYGYTPFLNYLGHDISDEIQRYGFFADTKMHDNLVDQMIQTLGNGSSTVTLVGDIGVGKTTCVAALAKRLLTDKSVPSSILHHRIVSLDAPSLISHAAQPGELEGLVVKLLNEAQKAKNIILFFDDAHVFFSQGTGSVDIANILQPALDSGAVQLIFAMTPKEWQAISASNAAIASKLQSLQVQPTNEPETLQVLRDQVLFVEYQRKVLYTHQAMREAFRLGSRYVDTQAMPGAALSVLKNAANSAKDGYITAEVVQQSIETSVGVKLQHSGGDESSKLLNLEAELHKYVINQKRAVSVIANALRRSRSGVGNPERPVGTFLFLGPTGVGKTELSKALARVYFGSVDSIVRVDMNQYLRPEDAQRLITPMIGDQLSFLGQVRKQPFSVILFDEIEKAHPNVVNLLLQMLDEGVMRDTENKAVSFKDAIIIATSNAGADEIRRMIDAGQDLAKQESAFVEGLIKKGAFAPEFLNRFDEVVLFRPLNQDELVQVIDLIIADLNKTLDARKVRVVLSEPAKRWLVDKGYDSRLGARPMRRMAQRYVENILAKRLLDQTTQAGSEVSLDVPDFENIAKEE